MTKWTKEQALKELEQLISEIENLHDESFKSASHTRWVVRLAEFLEEVFGENSRYFGTIAHIDWGNPGQVLMSAREAYFDFQGAMEKRGQQVYRRQLEGTKGVLQAAADKLARTDIESVYEGKDTAPEASLIIKIINLSDRKLRKVIRPQPDKEKVVQDAFEFLLIGADIEYSREADHIEYSSKTYIPDFTINKADLAIEIKLCTKIEHEKSIISQVNDDILAYRTKYGHLLFVVYDCGIIRDTDRFITHFEKNENVIVKVVKH